MSVILVVDDEPIQCALIKKILMDKDHVVYSAHYGKDGLQIANSREIDLVVTDIVMPEMDGIAMARAIQATHRDMPVIFITGKEKGKEMFMEADELSKADYLEKPVGKEEILHLVGQLLKPVKS